MRKNKAFFAFALSMITVLAMIAIPLSQIADAGPTKKTVVETHYTCYAGPLLCSSYFKTTIETEESWWHQIWLHDDDHSTNYGYKKVDSRESVSSCSECSF